MSTRSQVASGRQEMSCAPRFQGRLRRLVVVSSVALGLIALLAALSTNASPTVIGLLVSGWILMPALLYASMERPFLRYLLALPATLVAAGLISVAVDFQGEPMTRAGWWLITVGVIFGGGLGTWFWYRWMPVPDVLEDPFSPGRIGLIAVHVALVVLGMWLVIAA